MMCVSSSWEKRKKSNRNVLCRNFKLKMSSFFCSFLPFSLPSICYLSPVSVSFCGGSIIYHWSAKRMNTSKLKQFVLFIGNAAIHIAWLRVLWTYATEPVFANEDSCNSLVHSQTLTALAISGIELLNSLLGLTKSKPHQVLLFSSLATPLPPSNI